jgi:hypothetical protein
MSRLLSVFPVAALLVAAVPLSSAPRPGEKLDGPAVVGQAKSFHDLLEMTRTLVKNVAGDELFKVFEKEALPNLDPKKLPGIDPKRPFGFYGIIDGDLAKCRAVLLVPVISEKDFMEMLAHFEIPVNKGKDAGTFEVVTPPDIPFPIAGRIHKDYAYISIGGMDALESKAILDPKDVISDKEKSVAYLALRLDRVPTETKKALVGMLRERTDQLPEAIPDAELKAAFISARNLALRWLKMLGDEAKELSFRLNADTKTGDLSLELVLDGMPRSPLAEAIAKRGPTKNAFASLAGDDSAQSLFISAPLFADEAKDALVKLIEAGQRELAGAAASAPEEVKTLVDAFFKSLKTTVASGEMDLGAALRGPNKDGFFTAVAAVHCKEGSDLEKAIKGAVKHLPGQTSSYFKFDAGKIGTLSVHEIDMTAEAGDIVKAVFGNGQKAYFAFGKDAFYVSYGPDGMKLLKEAIEAKPGPAAVFDSSADPKKAKELFKKVFPPDNPNGRRPAFALGAQESMMMGGMKVTVDGGDHLTVRVKLNVGTMITFGLGMFASEARPAAPPAAVAAPVAPPPPPPPAKKKDK